MMIALLSASERFLLLPSEDTDINLIIEHYHNSSNLTGCLVDFRNCHVYGVEVLLYNCNNHYAAYMNKDGFFQFKGVVPDRYTMRIERYGLQREMLIKAKENFCRVIIKQKRHCCC